MTRENLHNTIDASNKVGALALACALALTLVVPWPAVAQQDGSGSLTVTVKDEEGGPLAGATVLVVELQRSATTDRGGEADLDLPPGNYSLLATAPGHGVGEKSVTIEAGGRENVTFALEIALSQFGEELVVIGSRAQRTAIETPVPVDVLSSDDIRDTGLTETSRVIQFLAPSFNYSTSTISDGTDAVRPSTLRGLGPDQTLVLINGKRRHNSALVHVNGSIGRGTAGTDLNAIPAAAIERIEILRDGAAAQYGSDAIAGVINIVLKSRLDTQVNISGGQHFAGDGERFNANVNHGLSLGKNGHFNFTLDYYDRGYTNRAGRDPRRIFNFLEQELFQPPLSEGTLDPREQTFDRLNHRYGDAEQDSLQAFFNSAVPLDDSTEFYFFGGVSVRDSESAGFYRLPNQSRTNIFLFPEGHLPLINTNIDDNSLAVGVRKSLSTWSLDASLAYGDNAFEFVITDSANTSLGPESPTEANAGELKFAQTTLNVDLFGTVGSDEMPLNLAFGFEARQDSYQIEAGEPASFTDGGFPDQFGGRAPAGIQVFPGFRPSNEVDEDRESFAVYGDLEFNPVEKLLVGLAARFEDFSDFGNNLSGKLALRYEVSERLALRGSVSTGFRAPSLHQQNFNNTSTQFILVDGELTPLEVGTFRNGSDVANAFGVPALEEETSLSYGAGFTLRPNQRLSITADLFKIDIDDRIVISGQFPASNPAIAPILEPFGVNAAQFFTNAIDTETEGADLVVAYFLPLGEGRGLSLTGAANWNDTEVVGEVRTPPTLEGFGETLFDRRERAFIERGQPRELYNLGARFTAGRFAVQARLNKFGAVTTVESPSDPSIDQTFSSKWLTDLDFTWTHSSGVKFSLGGNNVFDVFPDENRPEISFNGIFVYPRRTAPFGINGGSYYARIGFDF